MSHLVPNVQGIIFTCLRSNPLYVHPHKQHLEVLFLVLLQHMLCVLLLISQFKLIHLTPDRETIESELCGNLSTN